VHAHRLCQEMNGVADRETRNMSGINFCS